jgi:uncharacterized protein
MFSRLLFVPALVLTMNGATPSAKATGAKAPADYQASIEAWKKVRAERLLAEDGWLSLVGLSWLKEGDNSVGSSENNEVVLPKRAPAVAASIRYEDGKATVRAVGGAELKVNGKVVREAVLQSDAGGKNPDIAEVQGIKFYVIHRGTKDGVRVKDKESPARVGFKGIEYFPVNASWRVDAKWVREEKPISYDSMVGEKQDDKSPGYAEFTRGGKTYRLIATIDGGELFFVIRDQTSGKTTYPAARFVKAEVPKGDRVVLDFNKAYNPPCVFTPYATCPLPPPQNRLPFAVEAGEKNYKGDH